MDAPSSNSGGVSAGRPLEKLSEYASAADPRMYRVKDEVLFACSGHGDATVLCTTAGKTGRNGRTAAVGATVFWLTCPHLNNAVARVERFGGVHTAACCLDRSTGTRQRHRESHTRYLNRAQQLLTDEQWSFFRSHFVQPPDAHLRKYGNAAVSHEDDLKCLHALVAQSLGGATNPLGDAVLNYLLFLSALVAQAEGRVPSSQEAAPPQGPSCGSSGAVGTTTALSAEVVRSLASSEKLFDSFLRATVEVGDCENGTARTVPVEVLDGQLLVPVHWVAGTDSFSALSPDLCQQCFNLIVFLDGKPPTTRRKHRKN